jgi:fluoroacetyl-CoA thioesterase
MAKSIPLGIRGVAEQTVEFEHTLTYHNKALPPVYSTPHMIGLMEVAAFNALQSYADTGEVSVGTAINIEHRAPTGIGAHVKAEATLESANGRFFVFRVTAHNGKEEIGRGTVTRAFINVAKFAERHGKSAKSD